MANENEKRDGEDGGGGERPGSDPELGPRIDAVCQRIGTRKKAAEIAGISEDMLYRYIRGDSRVPLEPMAALCREAGVSLDWLAGGAGPAERSVSAAGGLDEALLRDVMEALEEHLAGRGITIAPGKKAMLIGELYMLLLEEEGGAAASGDLIARMVRLAS